MDLGLLFDCETNGLFPKKPRGQPQIRADDPAAPYIASLAWQLRDLTTWKIAGTGSFYIKPDGWTMPQGEGSAGAVNGLNDELLNAIGVPAIPVAAALSSILSKGVVLISHGAAFDSKMMRGFLRRNGFPDHYGKTKTFCTQITNVGVCKLKQEGSNRAKWPKLAEAFAHWFPGEQQPGAHSAWNDVLTLARLYKRMKDANMDMTPKEHTASEDGEPDGLQQALAEPPAMGAPAPANPAQRQQRQPAEAPNLDTPTLF